MTLFKFYQYLWIMLLNTLTKKYPFAQLNTNWLQKMMARPSAKTRLITFLTDFINKTKLQKVLDSAYPSPNPSLIEIIGKLPSPQIKSPNSNLIILEKDNKIKEYEEKVKKLERNLKLMEEKDKTIQKLTKINLKLKNSLELVSKKMDEKIQNVNFLKNKNNNNTFRSMNNLSYENLNKKEIKFESLGKKNNFQ